MERVLGVKLPRPGKKPAAKLSAAEGAKKGGVVRGGPPKRSVQGSRTELSSFGGTISSYSNVMNEQLYG
ncbi:hypothetical protein QTG54_002082 [Skeletonema marinoi]|uniref:Uncharacterized protein n=1 Tax=Skeletonema marinoi TaxID=267567 RepID=A0AAD8YI68_9STRA|nr:hypothetical protein QTG54_002082 [Skeletonema marinoi]